MKIMVASDIHGSASRCRMLMERFEAENPDRLLLLGDLLYHGPRNDLPDGYAPKEVAAMLNAISDKLLCVRGNCEAEVDQMMLDFPVMAEYCILYDGAHEIFATHGHKYGKDNPPKLPAGSILLCGHTHVTADEDCGTFRYLNPGSVSIPKNGTPRGYIVLENGGYRFEKL